VKTLITSKLGTLKNRLGDSSPASTEKSNATKQSNTTKKLTKQRLTGDIAEATALEYLQNRGLALVEKNYLCKCGEIDLIMSDRRSTTLAAGSRALPLPSKKNCDELRNCIYK